MRRFASIPVYELLVIAALAGIVAVCWLGWQILTPNAAPSPYAFKGFKIVGDKMYDDTGRHVGDWVPATDLESGHWKTLPFVAPEHRPSE